MSAARRGVLHEVYSKPAHAKPAYAGPRIALEFIVCATRLPSPGMSGQTSRDGYYWKAKFRRESGEDQREFAEQVKRHWEESERRRKRSTRAEQGKSTRSRQPTPSSNQRQPQVALQHPFWGDVSPPIPASKTPLFPPLPGNRAASGYSSTG